MSSSDSEDDWTSRTSISWNFVGVFTSLFGLFSESGLFGFFSESGLFGFLSELGEAKKESFNLLSFTRFSAVSCKILKILLVLNFNLLVTKKSNTFERN